MAETEPTADFQPRPEQLTQLQDSSEAALTLGEVVFDDKSRAILRYRWQRAGDVGLRFALQRRATPAKASALTRYKLRVESPTEAGNSLILPEAGDERYKKLMPYATFIYSRARGIISEPEGGMAATFRIFRLTADPYEEYFNILTEYLSYADRGWEEIR